jgi:dienelactone hydrolase
MKRLAALVFLAALGAASAIAQAPQPIKEIIDGRNTIRYAPPAPRAIIYLFHGSGGSENFATNATTRDTIDGLVKAGYGYAASASLQRTDPVRWNLSSADPVGNPDLAYMLALHKRLVALGEITATTPVFAMGMSNGGGFANLFSTVAKQQGLPVKAVANYMGPYPTPLAVLFEKGALPPPSFVVVAEHDGLVSAANVLANAEKIRKAGQTVETHQATETLVTPASFAAIEGIDAPASKAIFDDLVARKIIDGKGRRIVFVGQPTFSREDLENLLNMLPQGAQQRAIHRVLVAAWAGHMMRSDYAKEQFAFFEAALAK